MKIQTGARRGLQVLLSLLVVAAPLVANVEAQTTKMPSTLRYGSGLLDIPVASVLPHLGITGTYSGFSVDIPSRPVVDNRGIEVGRAGSLSKWYQDASVALGLFDRLEVGSSFQSFSDAGSGGNMVGLFGQALLLKPSRYGGLGLAVGARYLTSPTFDDIDPPADYQPGRLGFPDASLRSSYAGSREGVDTNFSPYAVGSAILPGFDARFLPDHDLTFALGWGDGLFRDGGKDLEWYAPSRSKGWFFGSAIHVDVADGTVLNLVGDYNGFDVNLGAQLDWGGVRVGGHVLGMNYETDASRYRTKKYGVMASVALCPSQGGLCKPELMEREPPPRPDTVRLPAPPPDTVVVEREVAPPLPTGEPARLCLATGQEVEVLVTAQRDTLVGPDRVPIESLRPGVVFAGAYAEDRDWFSGDETITLDETEYQKSGGEVRLGCSDIMRIGDHQGVPLFADRNADEPFETIYVPVRPGVWQAYEAGLRRTRG